MDRDRLMIFVIVGGRTFLHCLRKGAWIKIIKSVENLIRVQKLQQWLQDGKRIAQEVWKQMW